MKLIAKSIAVIKFLGDFSVNLEQCEIEKACTEVIVSSVIIQDAKNSPFMNGKKCNISQVEVKEDGNSTCKEKATDGKRPNSLS